MERIPANQNADYLVDKAMVIATAAVLSEDPYAIRELDDFLSSFAERQRDKILETKEAIKN